jgi:hypothetical protein
MMQRSMERKRPSVAQPAPVAAAGPGNRKAGGTLGYFYTDQYRRRLIGARCIPV